MEKQQKKAYLCSMKTNDLSPKEYLRHALAADSEAVKNGVGGNKIPEPEKEPLWKRYAEKFRDPLIIVLLVALALSCIVSGYEIHATGNWRLLFEPCGVLFAILLATGVGFIFEVKADKEFDVLNQVKDTQPVKVLRRPTAGAEVRMYSIPKMDVVVGDIVRVEAGDQMPADGILVEANALTVDESIFTGEPFATKEVLPTDQSSNDPGVDAGTLSNSQSDTAYPANRLLRGSSVIEGNGIYIVDKIAQDSEEGRGVALTREGSEVKTPLNRQLEQLGNWISYASFAIAALIVVGRIVYFFFFSDYAADGIEALEIFGFILQSIMIAITLIVVAVPEGLPMSVTVSLALSMRNMLKENNLVRKLHACETMGAATVICTDKTGTLTQNRMKVVEHRFFSHPSNSSNPSNSSTTLNSKLSTLNFSEAIAANSTAELTDGQNGSLLAIGNPTEGALLLWLHDQGIDYHALRLSAKVVSQQPFSTLTKYMLTVVEQPDGSRTHYYKGAPELLLERCQQIAGGATRTEVDTLLASYQTKAMRTLGFAHAEEHNGEVGPLTFDGIVGIADPIRPDVAEAIRQCKDDAGVKVIIVTGDTVGTANEIGRQIGLLAEGETDKTLQGPDFAALSDKEVRELLRAHRIKIIARARPEDKARLVTQLQRNHEVVAVTGDGTNDAPALAKAQVGLSMGSGTSRAKEASDITIIDDSFASINKAIMWGRSIYLNIRRFIIFQMIINVCACLIVLLGALVGLDSPLNVTQMLWVNLIMDTFAAGALSSLPADPRVLHDKPRSPRAHIIDRPMATRIAAWGLGFFIILTGLWQLLFHKDITCARELLDIDSLRLFVSGFFHGHGGKAALSGYEHGLFFTTFVVLQFWNLFNVRYFRTDRCFLLEVRDFFTDRARFRASFSTGFALVAVVILVGQYLIVNLLPDFFEVEALSLQDWLIILVSTSPVFIIPEIIRCVRLIQKMPLPRTS